MLNSQRQDSSDSVADELDGDHEAVEEFNREDKEQLGVVAPLKGGDEKGRKEEGTQKRKNGKSTRDVDTNLQGEQRRF